LTYRENSFKYPAKVVLRADGTGVLVVPSQSRERVLAKKKTTKKKSSTKKSKVIDATGKQLVIVESPAKARTINRYLGDEFVVTASVGHIRDLPPRSPKGVKQPVPGVDIENDFTPTYEIVKGKGSLIKDLKKAAKCADAVWFASDLDREGEAIAWHLAEELGIDPTSAKRVTFNEITKKRIEEAFEHPHPINMDFVQAQQARRILDRIVGYQVSPLLWKRVAGGLSAGRVQSVAVRIIVEREKLIEAHVPDETWNVSARFALNLKQATALLPQWQELINSKDDRGKQPTKKQLNEFLAQHCGVEGRLVEIGGKPFKLGRQADCSDDTADHQTALQQVCESVGLQGICIDVTGNPDGKGPAKSTISISGTISEGVTYRVRNLGHKETVVRPPAPFITSSLQASASTALGFGAKRTMRAAQALYEGIRIKGEGQIGLITYMRTDSTNIAGDAITSVRTYVADTYGDEYLPDKPNFYTKLPASMDDDQRRLYRLIWTRFVACQMTNAKWNRTEIFMIRDDKETGALFKTTGRTLAFDGFYKASGVPSSDSEQNLPDLKEHESLFPFDINAKQVFSSAPTRYSEASLIKELESQGIGRPSTYATIIDVIQRRNYVEKIDRSFYPTDLGIVVTEKLIEAFPILMGVEYTRSLEDRLDKIAAGDTGWVEMLHDFYGRFSARLETAYEEMSHAKAEMEPAVYKCPECGSQTAYRFGKNGRFLTCGAYPDCKYAAPIDRQGRPTLPERVDVACPEDGSSMEKRIGRFGPFLASVNYPEIKTCVNLDKKGGIKYPNPPPLLVDSLACEKCEKPMYLRRGKKGPWLGCSTFPKCKGRMGWKTLDETLQSELESALELHEREHPQIIVTRMDGTEIPEGTPVTDLLLPGGIAELELFESA